MTGARDDVDAIRAREPGARCWAWFDRADYWLLQAERVGMGVAAVFLAGVFLLLIAGVFARPWTGFLFSVSLEGGSMSMWPISYMGAGFIWRIYGHPQFDLVLRSTHARCHHVLQLLNNAGALLVGVLFAWLAWDSFLFQYQSQAATQNLRYLFWPVYWTAFVGLWLLVVELGFSLLRHIREIIHPTGSEHSIYGVFHEESSGPF